MISQALRIHETTVGRHINDYFQSEKFKPEKVAAKADFLLPKPCCLLSTWLKTLTPSPPNRCLCKSRIWYSLQHSGYEWSHYNRISHTEAQECAS